MTATETAKEAARRLAAPAIRDGFQPQALHEYRSADGVPAFWRIRCKHADGRKWIRPMKRNGDGFAIGEPPAPEAGKLLYRLPELLAADPARPVWMVEGESCADALARLAVTVTTTGAADSAGTADLSPLAGRHVIVWPDNDKPGGKYAEALRARLAAMGCTVEAVEVASLGLPDKGDCADWLEANPDATAAEVEALPRAPIQQEATALEPEPLPDDLPPVPELNPALLPEAVRAWCIDAAENLQVPLDFTAIPAMVALAGALGRRCALAMKESGRWYEMPILWGCVIGRPSTGKSPALEPSRRMLERLGEDERKAFESAHQHYEAQCLIADARKQGAKEEIRKAIKAGDEARAQALAESATEAQEAPQEPRLLVNDATIEKLGELLNANPRGLIQYRDELAGWLASMDREGREGDRAFWLECWNGKGGFTVDRIGRGTVRIEACAVSLLGGVQPGKLADYLRASMRGGAGNDGLMQRLQMAVYPDTLASWRYVDKPIDPEAERQAWGAFQRLRHIDPLECGATEQAHCPVPVFRLSADALAMFVEWQTELMQRLRAGDEPEWLESHLSKYPALAGRLALVLHLADAQRGEIATPTMARAVLVRTLGGARTAHLCQYRRWRHARCPPAIEQARRPWGAIQPARAVPQRLGRAGQGTGRGSHYRAAGIRALAGSAGIDRRQTIATLPMEGLPMNWREMAAFALPLESANLLTDKTDKSHPPCIASPPKRGTDKTDKSPRITAKAPDEALTKLTKGGFGSFGSKQNHVFAGKLPPDESTLAAIRRRLEILAEADRLPREIVGKQTDADLSACAGLTDAALAAYLHACHCTHLMAQGKLPPGYSARVNCAGCGTVWLPEGHPDRLQACPWCLHRLAGVSLPRPPVRCADCTHFQPCPHNPTAGAGLCEAGCSARWAMQPHTCQQFTIREATP